MTIAVVVVAAVGLALLITSQGPKASSPPQALAVPSQAVPSGLAHGRSLGQPNAPVKLDEWEDFQCPYCDQYTRTVEPQLITDYVTTGKVEITYHDFEFIGQESLTAAVAARCAGDQGQFWAYMEYLFSNQGTENSGTFNQALFDRIANALHLNQSTFDTCLADPSKATAVQDETSQGEKLGIQGTPTLFINGKQYSGTIDLSGISSAIDAALKAAPSPAAGGSPGVSPGASPAGASPAGASPSASPSASPTASASPS